MSDFPKRVRGFDLRNEDKVRRALDGSPDASGGAKGGVRKEDGSFEDKDLLAEYDRIGGFISKNGDKVKTGSFYDFRNKRPRVKPEVVFVYRVEGKEVEVPEGTELPGKVKAARILAEKESSKDTLRRKPRKEEKEEEVEEEEVSDEEVLPE